MPSVSRHLVRCGDRFVHLRRAGSGPAVLLLHESPSSSAMWLPTIERLADKCTVIAPDTPGNGESDPMAIDTPTISDYADALVQLLDTLGIGQVAALGVHTGGSCILELAARHAERLTVGVIGGLVAFPAAERDELLSRYFVDFEPEPSGAHMLRVWHRMRGQFIHFPWYEDRPERRLPVDVPLDDAIDGLAMDLLRCLASYRGPYAAAIAHDGAAGVSAARAPLAISAVRQDAIYSHVQAVPSESAAPLTVAHFDTFAEARTWQIEQLMAHLPDNAAAPPPAVEWQGGASRLRLGPDGATHARSRGSGSGRPVVLLHSAGSSSRQWESAASALGEDHPVLAIDLTGHGRSAPGDDNSTLEASVAAVEQAIRSIGWSDCALYGEGLGGRVVERLARRGATAYRHVTGPAEDPIVPDAVALRACVEALAPHAWGEHLVAAWHIARDAGLFEYWDTPSGSSSAPAADEAVALIAVQARALDLLLARQGLARLDCVPAVRAGRDSRNGDVRLPSQLRAGSADWLQSFQAAIA